MEEDKDGLLPTNNVVARDGRFYYGSEEIFVDPQCGGVVDYLTPKPALWRGARLRFTKDHYRMKRAPIIGVPFSRAFEEAKSISSGLQKSMFEDPNWTNYQGKAVVATMLAHTSATRTAIEFQAWQFLDVSTETFYVHAIIEKASEQVIHLDGATMIHSDEQHYEIRSFARKLKGDGYTKHFRIDGEFDVSAAKDVMDLYFPIQTLTKEFLDAMQSHISSV